MLQFYGWRVIAFDHLEQVAAAPDIGWRVAAANVCRITCYRQHVNTHHTLRESVPGESPSLSVLRAVVTLGGRFSPVEGFAD